MHKTANKYGLFSEPSYLTIGDKYDKKIDEGSRHTGLNLKAAIQKTGKGNDICFDKFKPLYEKEKYALTFEELAAQRASEKGKRAADVPFKPSNPQKKSSGLGNYYGCIGPKVAHLKEIEKTDKKKGDFEVGPRNVVTNPPKKGTYGFKGTTLGEKADKIGGAAGEYSYMPEKYDAARVAEIEAAKASAAKMQGNPFKPANPPKKGGPGVPGRTLNGKGKGVVGEFGYIENGPDKKEKAEEIEKPFRPSHPPKAGYNSTLNKFPHYMEDPLDLKLAREKEARKAEADRMSQQPKFVPPSTLKGGATSSVLRMNLK